MTRDIRGEALTFLLAVFAFALALPSAHAGLFDHPDPQVIYEGTTKGLSNDGVALRDAESFRQAIRGLEPPFAGDTPDFDEYTVLRIVGRPIDDTCRSTRLTRIDTRNRRAFVYLEERIPEQPCRCEKADGSSRTWLILVGRSVRRVEIQATDVVTPCEEIAAAQPDSDAPRPVLEGDGVHDAAPGAEIVITQKRLAEVCRALGLGDVNCPEVDFGDERVVVVTGRARENGCRATRLADASLVTDDEGKLQARFVVEELYPGKGQICTDIMRQPKGFLFRVPADVASAKVVTRELTR